MQKCPALAQTEFGRFVNRIETGGGGGDADYTQHITASLPGFNKTVDYLIKIFLKSNSLTRTPKGWKDWVPFRQGRTKWRNKGVFDTSIQIIFGGTVD